MASRLEPLGWLTPVVPNSWVKSMTDFVGVILDTQVSPTNDYLEEYIAVNGNGFASILQSEDICRCVEPDYSECHG